MKTRNCWRPRRRKHFIGKVDAVHLVLRAASKAQCRGCQSDHGNNVSTQQVQFDFFYSVLRFFCCCFFPIWCMPKREATVCHLSLALAGVFKMCQMNWTFLLWFFFLTQNVSLALLQFQTTSGSLFRDQQHKAVVC